MPKTKEEKKTLKQFEKEYGDKYGDAVYFALRNKNKKFDRSQGGGYSSKKSILEKAMWVARIISKMPESIKSSVLKSYSPSQQWWIKHASVLIKNYRDDENKKQLAAEWYNALDGSRQFNDNED